MENNNVPSRSFWETLLKSKTVSRLKQNNGLMTGLKIGISLFVLLFLSIAFYPENKQENSLESQELKDLISKTKNSIEAVNKKTDPFVRELMIQSESKKLEIKPDEYKKLLALQKSNPDLLPDVRRENLLSPIVWFYQDLSRSQRLKLTGQGLLWFLGILPNLTILYVGWKFLQEIPQRERQAKYQAWQVIHTAHNQKVCGARIAALEDLVEQGESLAGLTLVNGADLEKANLFDANLSKANLEVANLSKANLEVAFLCYANLKGAVLSSANLKGANLWKANLEVAFLFSANLKGAFLFSANLKGAFLSKANLEGANLEDANLEGAYLSYANLKGAYLSKANLEGASLEGAYLKDAYLKDAKELTREQLDDTYLCNTNLPDNLKDLSNRDCAEDEKEWINKWRKKLEEI